MPASDQGVNRERYQLIPRTLIFITRGESVLLLKGAPDKRIWANRYNGVGGHIERGEDVYSAARREVLEETGLIPDQIRLVGTITVNTGEDVGIGIYVFRGVCAQGKPRSSNEGNLVWVPFRELDSLDLVEDLPVLLPRVLAHQTDDPPFAARYSYDQEDELVIAFSDQDR